MSNHLTNNCCGGCDHCGQGNEYGDLSCDCNKKLIGEISKVEQCKFFKVNFIYNEGSNIDIDFFLDAMNYSFSEDSLDTSLYGERKQRDTLIRFEKVGEQILKGNWAKEFQDFSEARDTVLNDPTMAMNHGFIENAINVYFVDLVDSSEEQAGAWGFFPDSGFPWRGSILYRTKDPRGTSKNYRHSLMIHELGHVFKLTHTFGEKDMPCDDDDIGDTPITNVNWNLTRTDTCGDGFSMNENWMDYGFADMTIPPKTFFFTKQQNEKMQQAINDYLSGFYEVRFCDSNNYHLLETDACNPIEYAVQNSFEIKKGNTYVIEVKTDSVDTSDHKNHWWEIEFFKNTTESQVVTSGGQFTCRYYDGINPVTGLPDGYPYWFCDDPDNHGIFSTYEECFESCDVSNEVSVAKSPAWNTGSKSRINCGTQDPFLTDPFDPITPPPPLLNEYGACCKWSPMSAPGKWVCFLGTEEECRAKDESNYYPEIYYQWYEAGTTCNGDYFSGNWCGGLTPGGSPGGCATLEDCEKSVIAMSDL